jgi:plasmid stability protein
MKTTLEIPDDLMREIKVRAAREDRKLKDLVAELLRRGLTEADRPPRRVKLPLIHSTHPAAPGEEMTPERMAQILIDQEVEWALGTE